jgi:hypothetical protein
MQLAKTVRDFLREPLFRLLAINLAIGISVAVLLLGGLLAFNPHGLRDLIVGDRSPLVPLLLLLFGFVVTFGSVAMGTAIMAIGRTESGQGGGRRQDEPVPVPVRTHQSRHLFRNDLNVTE